MPAPHSHVCFWISWPAQVTPIWDLISYLVTWEKSTATSINDLSPPSIWMHSFFYFAWYGAPNNVFVTTNRGKRTIHPLVGLAIELGKAMAVCVCWVGLFNNRNPFENPDPLTLSLEGSGTPVLSAWRPMAHQKTPCLRHSSWLMSEWNFNFKYS